MISNAARYLAPDDMDKMTSTKRVFARALPEDKLEIVKSLQRQDCVVAMTGDGARLAGEPAVRQRGFMVKSISMFLVAKSVSHFSTECQQLFKSNFYTLYIVSKIFRLERKNV